MRIGRGLAFASGLLVATAEGPVALAQPAAGVVRVAGETSPLGWPFSTFAEGIVDARGGLVFVASSTAVFERQGGPIVQRIGAGSVLPDGRRVADVGAPALAADGCVFARATFTTGGEAIVRACGTTFTVVIDAGTPSPGGGTLRAFDPAVFVAGTSMLGAAATLQDGTSVLLRHDGTTLVELARSGAPAPSGGTYATLRLLGVTATARLGFRAAVSEGPNGFFVVGDDGTRAVAVVGQGSPAGGGFTEVGGGSVHPGGRAAFRASISTDEGAGIFTVDLGDPLLLLRAVVLRGDPLPIAGATIRGFLGSIDPSINGGGTVAFRALVEGATDPARPSGIFTATPLGGLTVVATVREDRGDLGVISRLHDPVLADDGSVLVSAVMAGKGPGLFVARDGALVPLARLGDATTVDTGDSRFRFGPASVGATAESATFLGQRDAIFRAAPGGGPVTALAYTGRPSPLGGVIATLGPPVVDARQTVFFGAEFQDAQSSEAQFNEALLIVTDGTLDVLIAPDRRLLGGGGIRELFPTGVDTLARPAGASLGVAFTAALQGAKASEALFLARSAKRVKAIVRVGQRAGGDRIASLGSPAVGPGNAMALLAEIGRDARKTAVVAAGGGGAAVIAVVGQSTRTRIGGKFAQLDSAIAARRGTVFRAVLDTPSTEGLFIGRGRRMGLVAGTGDTTTAGSRLRAFDSPLAVGDEVWFLARVSGSVAPAGLYRVRVPRIPRKDDPPIVEPVLLPGDPAPLAVGGVIVRLDAPRVGPAGLVTVVAGIGGGAAATAILEFAPSLP